MLTPEQIRLANTWTIAVYHVLLYCQSLPNATDKLSPYSLLLSYGVAANDDIRTRLEFEIQKSNQAKLLPGPYAKDAPILFHNLASRNTWFVLHPEKIAGVEEITTSFHFPVKIKGDKEDIIRTIRAGMGKKPVETGVDAGETKAHKLKLAKAKAKAAAARIRVLLALNETPVSTSIGAMPDTDADWNELTYGIPHLPAEAVSGLLGYSDEQNDAVFRAVAKKIVMALAASGSYEVSPIANRNRPSNYFTGLPYAASNAIVLREFQQANGFRSNFYIEDWQLQRYLPDARIKPDAPSEGVIGQRSGRVIPFGIYSVESITGLSLVEETAIAPDLVQNANRILHDIDPIPNIQYVANVSVLAKNAAAFYSPSDDKIVIGYPDVFRSQEYFYRTLFHEIIHWTGPRLGRKFGRVNGDYDYAIEELVAEFGAAFLCAEAGILHTTSAKAAAYLNYYQKIASGKSSSELIIRAAARAQQAADFVLGQSNTDMTTYQDRADRFLERDRKLAIARQQAKNNLARLQNLKRNDLLGIDAPISHHIGLSGGMAEFMTDNPASVAVVLRQSRNRNGLAGLGKVTAAPKKAADVPQLTFDQVLAKYNPGISTADIKAWVYYRRNLMGVPMTGWEGYFINEDGADELVKSGHLFFHNFQYLPMPVYAYANIYDQQQQLERDKVKIAETFGEELGSVIYERQAALLLQVRPSQLSVLNPDSSQRPKILAHSKFARQFVGSCRDAFGSISQRQGESLFNSFKYALERSDIYSEEVQFGISTYQISRFYLDNTAMSTRNYSPEFIENMNTYAPIEGERLFADFLHRVLTLDNQQELDILWNRTYNGWSSVPFESVPVGFPCSAKFKQFDFQFTPIQREAVAFLQSVGSGIIAYDVGVGKTIASIITLANEIQAGKCQRPLIVVPNQTYNKWLRELFGYTDDKTGEFMAGVLSGTGIGLNDWYNLGSEKLKELEKAKLVTKDQYDNYVFKPVDKNSITVLTYEGFNKIGFGQKVMDGLFLQLKDILAQASDRENSKGGSKRDLEKAYQTYRELIGTGNKNTICDIDALKLDYLIIDEAHNFKNVFAYVPTDDEGDKRFALDAAESARAKRAFFLCNYIQRTYGSNVMLLTATPFSNNPLEIYSMLSLVAYDKLKAAKLLNLYDFMERFINQQQEYVNNYDGKIVRKPVVKAYNNRLLLQRLIFNSIHYKTGEEAGVKRPCKINLPRVTVADAATGLVKKLPREDQLVTYLQMTPAQQRNQAYLQQMAQRGGSRSERMANVMRALAGSLDNALSPYIYDKAKPESARQFVDESPKIKYTVECIRSVKAYHEGRNEPVSGQVIYSNRGKDYFKYIKEYLETEVGYKKKIKIKTSTGGNTTVDEVEIITSAVSQDDREIIKDAFLEGQCKIILGTASIREGIDLQKNGTVLYNMYPDWNPTDVKQLEGRIWRQGNQFGYVRIVMPLVQDSMDVFVFQKLDEKTARVNDIWYRAGRSNVLNVESLDPEDVKFALYTDLVELSKIVIEKEEAVAVRDVKRYEGQIKTFKETQFAVRKLTESRGGMQMQAQQWKVALVDFEGLVAVTPAMWSTYPESQMKLFTENAKRYVDEINAYQRSVPQDDKVLIDISNRVQYSIFSTMSVLTVKRAILEDFRQYVKTVAKAEESVLKENGYTIDADFDTVIADLEAKADQSRVILERIKSDEYREEIIRDIRKRKEENMVDGRPPEAASADFKRLNHLLQYRFNDTDTDGCLLPGSSDKPGSDKDTTPPDETKARKIKLAKAKAKAAAARIRVLLALQ